MADAAAAYDAPSLAELIDLGGRVALVTGAAQGFGFASARRLAEAGAAVVLTDRSADRLEAAAGRLAEQHGELVSFAVGDVSVSEEVDALVEAAVARYGRLDVLVNNAATYSNYVIPEMPHDTFAGVLDVNVNGAFWCARQAARQMLQQGDGGSIVNVTSIDALHPTSKGMSHYTTSKHALWGLTKCLALELGPEGIRTNAVAPGPSLTEGAIEYIEAGAPEGIDIQKQWADAALRVPMRRWAEPDEIARVVVFLASDLAAYVNGAQIVVDGGYLLGS
ncbi:MAG TPA: SDR family oxidoreductase [Gaiellaceae bacterium]|jgi:2-deoxy-D-gluconate 3-dehydrogenase